MSGSTRLVEDHPATGCLHRQLSRCVNCDIFKLDIAQTRMNRPAKQRPIAGLLAWLVAAMLLAQALGLMHGIVHAPHAGALHQSVAGGQLDGELAQGWVARLFAAHDDDSACRLYDQTSHGDCAPAVGALPLPVLLAPDFFAIFEALAPSLPAALIQARGPPPVR